MDLWSWEWSVWDENPPFLVLNYVVNKAVAETGIQWAIKHYELLIMHKCHQYSEVILYHIQGLILHKRFHHTDIQSQSINPSICLFYYIANVLGPCFLKSGTIIFFTNLCFSYYIKHHRYRNKIDMGRFLLRVTCKRIKWTLPCRVNFLTQWIGRGQVTAFHVKLNFDSLTQSVTVSLKLIVPRNNKHEKVYPYSLATEEWRQPMC